jgi:hypothetical protein
LGFGMAAAAAVIVITRRLTCVAGAISPGLTALGTVGATAQNDREISRLFHDATKHTVESTRSTCPPRFLRGRKRTNLGAADLSARSGADRVHDAVADRSLFVRQGLRALSAASRVAVDGGLRVVGSLSGPGVACAKRRSSGHWAGHAGLWSRCLNCPPGPVSCAGRRQPRDAVDRITDAPLQRAERGSAGQALRTLAVVVGAARAVAVPELGHYRDANYVVQGAVASSGEPVDRPGRVG